MAEDNKKDDKDDDSGGGLIPPLSTLVAPFMGCLGAPEDTDYGIKPVITGVIGANLGPIKPMIDILEIPDPIKIAADLPGLAVDLPGLVLAGFMVPGLPALTLPAPFDISLPGPPGFGIELGMMVFGLLMLPIDLIGAMLKIPPDIPTLDMVIDLMLKGIGIPSIGVLGMIECLAPLILMVLLIPIALFP